MTSLGALSLLLAHQPTLRDVFDTLSNYRTLLNDALTLRIVDEGDHVVVEQELLCAKSRPMTQAVELGTGMLVQVVRQFLGPQWHPARTTFTHRAPENGVVFADYLGPHLVFGDDANRIYLRRADVERQNPAGDAVLVDHARRFIDAPPLASRETTAGAVRRALLHLFPASDVSIGRVAAHLGLCVRSLQRRLLEDGTTFSVIIDEVRGTLAARLLANRRLSMTDIAGMLGFAQSSAFTRWFVARFGETPSHHRHMILRPQSTAPTMAPAHADRAMSAAGPAPSRSSDVWHQPTG